MVNGVNPKTPNKGFIFFTWFGASALPIFLQKLVLFLDFLEYVHPEEKAHNFYF